MKKPDLRGKVPESWACIDCGVNTAPGHLNREQMEQALALDWNNQGVTQTYGELTEIYMVAEPIWEAAGMEPMGGCLVSVVLKSGSAGQLTPKDFMREHWCNKMPGTKRLLARRSL